MTAATQAQPTGRDRAVISSVGFAHGTSHFFHLMLPPLFPWLMQDFALSYTQVGALMTLFFVISGIGQALGGFVVDRFGAWRVLVGAIALLALSGLALAAAQSYPMLMAAAVLAGLGNSPFHPADFTLLNRKVSQPRLGAAFSVHGLTGFLGWGLAPVLMTGVATAAGWRAAGLAAAAVGTAALAVVLLSRSLLADEVDESARGAQAGTPKGGTLQFLRVPDVWMCFAFFLVATMAFGALQNFGPPALGQMYDLSVTAAASTLTAFMFGGAAGTALGGFLASRPEGHDRVIAAAFAGAAVISLLVASAEVPGWSVAGLMALMGTLGGIAGPSRDMLVRRAATSRFGQSAYGRVYGFVYSGLDLGLAIAPLGFGLFMDAGRHSLVLVGIAVLQVGAIFTALRVGQGAARPAAAAPGA